MTRIQVLESKLAHTEKLIAQLDASRAELVKQRDELWDEKIDIQNEENMQSYNDRDKFEAYQRGDMQ